MVIIYSTFPDKVTALSIGKNLLDEKLICCSNIFPITSQYVWEEKLITDEEYGCYFKTTKELKDKAIELIGHSHPYDVPMISHRHVEINDKYADWANEFLA